MRVFVAALLLSCATATVNTVPLADDTEFDAFLPPSTPPAGVEVPSLNTVPIATPPPAVVTPTAAPRRTAEPHDWTFEALAVIGVVAYIGYYVVGRRANAQVAQAFVDAYRPWLREQFSQAGIGADNPASSPLIKSARGTMAASNASCHTAALPSSRPAAVSDVSWEMWCSGRANCLGLLATLALRPRQDLAITALSALAPQPAAALASHVDVLTLELPIPASSPGPAFVFAVAEARRSKDFLEARKDITAVNPKVSTGRAAGLPDAYEVHSESHEVRGAVAAMVPRTRSSPLPSQITEAVLESGLRRLINDYPRVLRSLHITDQPALASSCWWVGKGRGERAGAWGKLPAQRHSPAVLPLPRPAASPRRPSRAPCAACASSSSCRPRAMRGTPSCAPLCRRLWGSWTASQRCACQRGCVPAAAAAAAGLPHPLPLYPPAVPAAGGGQGGGCACGAACGRRARPAARARRGGAARSRREEAAGGGRGASIPGGGEGCVCAICWALCDWG